MSNDLPVVPAGWRRERLGNLFAEPSRSGLYKPSEHYGSGPLMIHMPQMFRKKVVDVSDAANVSVSLIELERFGLREGDLLFARRSLTLEGAGQCSLVPSLATPTTFESSIIRVRVQRNVICPAYINIFLGSEIGFRRRLRLVRQVAVSGVSSADVASIPIDFPNRKHQQYIVDLFGAADEAIEQTEALIAKYQPINAGLMHNLFTRGVTANGQLRPIREEAPHLYKQSPLGWIPRDWTPFPINDVVESVVDGPFGSNLKTEHYVVDPGVRVVRLQNIDQGHYNDADRAFVSERHAAFLSRNEVVGGDILVAGLGEDNNVVGRACCYPLDLPPAINKADCFRLRCKPSLALNEFIMLFFNTSSARTQIRRFEQGVTRRRINTGNLKKLIVGLPPLPEQALIGNLFQSAKNLISIHSDAVNKLRQQKHGLMQDLLTGHAPVKFRHTDTTG